MSEHGQIENKCGECGAIAKLNVYHQDNKIMFEIACSSGCYSSGFKNSFEESLERWDKIYNYLKEQNNNK